MMRQFSSGFSLVETSVIILFVSLAMIPVVSMMGGVNDPSGSSVAGGTNVTAIAGFRSKTMTAANTIMERAQAGDTSVSFDINQVFPTISGGTCVAPTSTGTCNGPVRAFTPDRTAAYQQPIWYDWVVRDLRARVNSTGQLIDWTNNVTTTPVETAPDGNQVVVATLRIFERQADRDAGKPPIMTLPTYFSRQDCSGSSCVVSAEMNTGLVFVLDISGSMSCHVVECNMPGGTGMGGVSSPWLKNRYNGLLGNTVVPAIQIADLYDDRTLDLTYFNPYDALYEDSETPYIEQYFKPAGQGVAYPAPQNGLDFHSGCHDLVSSPANQGQVQPYFNFTLGNNTKTRVIERLCGQNREGPRWWNGNMANGSTRDNAAVTSGRWEQMINYDMSRIEASRNAIMSTVVTLEQNQFLAQYMKMGLVTFHNSFQKRVDLEFPADPPGPISDKKFINMRQRVAMINRDGTNNGSEITPNGGTHMLSGLNEAAKMLYSDPDIDNRIIIGITDGVVNGGSTGSSRWPVGYSHPVVPGPYTPAGTCNGNVAEFAQKVGAGQTPANGYSGPPAGGRAINIFSIGVIGYEPRTMACLAQTPNGQFFAVDSVADMAPIFDQLAYQLERLAMIGRLQRLNLPVKTGA